MESSYANRMESQLGTAAALVTPRAGHSFDSPEGEIRRGIAVRRDHPAAIANRGKFTNAPRGCEEHPSVKRAQRVAASVTRPATKLAEEGSE